MVSEKKEHPKEKTQLHPRNKHRERYDFKLLIQDYPALSKFVKLNDYKDEFRRLIPYSWVSCQHRKGY